MDRNMVRDLEAQADLVALDLEHRDLEQLLEAVGASDTTAS